MRYSKKMRNLKTFESFRVNESATQPSFSEVVNALASGMQLLMKKDPNLAEEIQSQITPDAKAEATSLSNNPSKLIEIAKRTFSLGGMNESNVLQGAISIGRRIRKYLTRALLGGLISGVLLGAVCSLIGVLCGAELIGSGGGDYTYGGDTGADVVVSHANKFLGLTTDQWANGIWFLIGAFAVAAILVVGGLITRGVAALVGKDDELNAWYQETLDDAFGKD